LNKGNTLEHYEILQVSRILSLYIKLSPLTLCNLKESTLYSILRQRGGGGGKAWSPDREAMCLSAGGYISQTIVKDPYPPYIWDVDSTTWLSVQIVNSVKFEEISGLAAPPTPISMEQYITNGQPFYKIVDEAPSDIFGNFADVKSVTEIDEERGGGAGKPDTYRPSLPQFCCVCYWRLRELM